MDAQPPAQTHLRTTVRRLAQSMAAPSTQGRFNPILMCQALPIWGVDNLCRTGIGGEF